MLSQNFIWIALVIALVGSAFYLRDTLKGETKPNKVSYFLGGIVPLIAYFSQRSGGGGIQILYTLVLSLSFFVIVAASFMNKGAYWKITKFDIACAVLTLFALLLLVVADKAKLALLFSILADFCAALPLIPKSYKYPDTETVMAYGLDVISAVVILLTIHKWIFVNYFFAVYVLSMSILFTSLLLFSPEKLAKKS